MSNFNMETITCPKCKTEQKIKIWESVNIAQSPKQKENILNGDFFTFKCKKCDCSMPIGYSFLYDEIEKKIMIWLLPDATEETIDSIKEYSKSIIDENQLKAKNCILRIVTTPNELREKIMINDAGLDDRVVELVKMVYLSQIVNNSEDKTIGEKIIEEMLIDVKGENDYYLVIFFKDEEPMMFPVQYEVYIKVYQDFIELIEENEQENFEIIDSDYAKRIFALANFESKMEENDK